MDPEMKHILGTVEFSVGYAFYPEDGTDYHVLMHISDERMYEEKRNVKAEGAEKNETVSSFRSSSWKTGK